MPFTIPYIPRRYLVSAVAFFVLLVFYFFRAAMSIAIIVMCIPVKSKSTSSSSSCSRSSHNITFIPPFNYDYQQQGTIISSYFWGYAATNFLGSIVADLIGVRWTMTVSLAGASLFTFLTVPLALAKTNGYEALIAARFLVGLFCGPLYACMHELLGHWAPLKERTSMTVGTHAGNIMGLVVCFSIGYFIDRSADGWKNFFYLSGGMGVLCLVLWLIFVYDHPWSHPFISNEEKDMIVNSLYPDGVTCKKESIRSIPFKHIFTSVHVYLAALAHLGNNYILYTFLTGFTKFLHEVFGFAANQASILSIIPFVVNFLFQLTSSYLTQFFQLHSNRSVTFFRKVNGIIGFGGSFIFMLPAGFFGCDGYIGAIIFLTLSMGFLAFNQSGFFAAMVDLDPYHAGTTMGLCNTIGTISGFINPLMVAAFTTAYGSANGWKYSFIATACISIISGSVWIVFSSSETQPWVHKHKVHAMGPMTVVVEEDAKVKDKTDEQDE